MHARTLSKKTTTIFRGIHANNLAIKPLIINTTSNWGENNILKNFLCKKFEWVLQSILYVDGI